MDGFDVELVIFERVGRKGTLRAVMSVRCRCLGDARRLGAIITCGMSQWVAFIQEPLPLVIA